MEDFSKRAGSIFDALKAENASKVIVVANDDDKLHVQQIVNQADKQGLEVVVLTKEEAKEQGYDVDSLKEHYVALQEYKMSAVGIEDTLCKMNYMGNVVLEEERVCRREQREQMKQRSRYLSKHFRK